MYEIVLISFYIIYLFIYLLNLNYYIYYFYIIYLYMNKNLKSYKCCLRNKDYNSSDGMITQIFGSAYWFTLHITSFNYPADPKKYNKIYNKEHSIKNYKVQDYYATMIENLQHILPCKSCRENLTINLKNLKWFEKKEYHLKNRENFSKFVYNLHNIVNKMLGKPKYKNYEYVRDEFSAFRASCPKKSKKTCTNKHKPGCTKLDINDEYKGKVVKGKCKISIVPQDNDNENIKIDEKCSIIAARDRKNKSTKKM